jgi:uncharacterized protein (TIGR03067 family)
VNAYDQEYTVRFDRDATPKAIDLTGVTGRRKGQHALGIYRILGTELHVCLTWAKRAPRPKRFNGFGDDGKGDDPGRRMLWLLRAEKEK